MFNAKTLALMHILRHSITMSKEDENSSIGGRIARYGRVSTTMAGLGARLIGEKYLGIEIKREEHAAQLTQALGNLKGPLMKVGQILSTIPEALPPEYAQTFQQLQSNAPPMGWSFVKRRMKAELGNDWQDRFTSFDKEAAAAASLGQVHKAVTLDGRDIACKLQYPDMQSAIEADLKQLKMIFSIYERYDKAIKTSDVHAELAERLKEELDYTLEAKYTALYKHMLRNEPNVHVPEIIGDISTSRLICSSWLEGNKILDYKDASQEDRNQIAMNMFRAWYVPFYHYGIIHGDPHLGNYSVRPDDLSINLLDFGCVRIFPPKFVGGVIDLYRALQEDDTERAVHAYETWGFEGLSTEQVETLNIWARFLYGPILDDKVRPIGEVTNGVYGREIAEKVHEQLRQVGGVKIPREFVFMDRAALGLGSVFLHLKAEINWHNVFNELIEGFDLTKLEQAQKDVLAKFEV